MNNLVGRTLRHIEQDRIGECIAVWCIAGAQHRGSLDSTIEHKVFYTADWWLLVNAGGQLESWHYTEVGLV